MPDVDELRARALSYLSEQLGPRAPADLIPLATFDEQPLDGEGPVALFGFSLAPAAAALAAGAPRDPAHIVVVGDTEPNFAPAYALNPDDAYSLHIGTRFMLVLGVATADSADEPPDARPAVAAYCDETNPGLPRTAPALAALFRAADQRFAVYRVTLAGTTVYCVAGDLPPGLYRLADYPPAVALRLHLGRLIRAEARLAEQRALVDQMKSRGR